VGNPRLPTWAEGVRIPMKWGTNSDRSGAASEQATLVTAMFSEVPQFSQDLCE
jgi:hypothetical protein